jgi:hypothetical protein
MMQWIGGVPLEIQILLPRIAMLQMFWPPFAPDASSEEIAVIQLLTGVPSLRSPVLDLHRVGIDADPPHAIATKPPLFTD